MKALLPIFALAVGSASTVPAASGEDSVAIRLEYYDLDHGTLNALLSAADSGDASSLRASVLERVQAGEATQVESTYLHTKSGLSARVESIIEWIYPVQYDTPNSPQSVTGPVGADSDLIGSLTPNALETRNVGLILVVDPGARSDGEGSGIHLAQELCVYLGDNTYGQDESTVNHPVFYSLRDQVGFTAKRGHWTIVSVHPPPPAAVGATPPRDRRILALLRTDHSPHSESDSPDEEPDDPRGDTPVPPAPISAQVGMLIEWFEMDSSSATRLLDENPDAHADATALRETLRNWVTEERASLFESAYLVTKSGQRAKSETSKHWIYPSEVAPGNGGWVVVGPIDPAARLRTRVNYSSLKTRLLGTIVEADPVVRPDGGTIDLELAPEIAEFGADRTIGYGTSSIEQPVFFSMKTQSSVAVRSGVPVVLSQHSPRPADVIGPHFGSEKRILCLVTARILKAK
ncbi:hypothetical protein BH23VER1_BH23VER1_04490 [soil metagenome]